MIIDFKIKTPDDIFNIKIYWKRSLQKSLFFVSAYSK